MIDFQYWYIFPVAVIVATLCNSSGFSGSVLFQPFFNFILGIPISQSVATGIATESIGMSSGAFRYWKMGNKIDLKSVRIVFPYVYVGIFVGIFLFSFMPKLWLRLLVGFAIFCIASTQFYLIYSKKIDSRVKNIDALKSKKSRIKQFFSGIFSASTGTGIAEIHQPIFQHDVNLSVKEANASAILIEALGNLLITLLNIKLDNINYSILIFSGSGVLIGGQIGSILSDYVDDKILKTLFCICVSAIGLIYIFTSIQKIFYF